jgi:hypothetical protein
MIEYKSIITWFASDERATTCFKLRVYDDQGRLAQEGRRLQFTGRHETLAFNNVQSVTLESQMPNWPLHLIGSLALGLYLTSRGYPPINALAIVAATVTVGISIGRAKWIKVTYRDEAGQQKQVWLADGSNAGWTGVAGGTKVLHDRIQLNLNAPQSSASGPWTIEPPAETENF